MNCKLYVTGFPKVWKSDEIEKYIQDKFTRFGEFTTSIQFSPSEFKFFAFVNYTFLTSAIDAKNALDNELIDERFKNRLYINFAKDKVHQKIVKKSSLFIKSIKEGTTEARVKQIFEKFGEVLHATLKEKKITVDGQQKGVCFCFINFSNPSEAHNAYSTARSDPEVMEIIDTDLIIKDPNFIHFSKDKHHHGKKIPQAFLQR